MSLLLSLYLTEIVVKPIEAFFPEPAVALDPIGDLPERTAPEPAGPPLRPPALGDQSRALEDLEVL